MKLNFKNDYNSIGDINILNKLIEYANEKNVGYGEDIHSKNLNKLVKEKCEKDVDTYVLSGGTVTNIVALNQILKYPYEAVITVDTSHINVHETGALEASGHKIILTPALDGKIDIKKIENTFRSYSDNHMVMPKALYLSNTNELGITYTLEELKEVYEICQKLGLYFFIDGARLPIALVKEGYTLKDISSVCDMFYIGGTKNGLMYGELLIIINEDLKKNFKYILKNKLGLLAKGFASAIMFEEYLKNDYYLDLAEENLKKAEKIRKRVKKYLVYKDNTNQIFIKLKEEDANKLEEYVMLENWEKGNGYRILRIVTAFNTTDKEIEELFYVFDKLGL